MNPSSSSLSSSSSSKRKRNPNSFDEPNCKRPKNDVFMNYSFEDIGKSFISHLQGALRRNSFTISDHTMLPIGQDVCSELLKAIEESEIYVLVFSNNYAVSITCLDELVYIMNCFHKNDQRKVLPVFFNVEPSHVRSQQGSFNEAFETHETNFDPERVRKWRQALNDAGQLSGHHLQNGDEEKFIRKIVKELGKMQNPQELQVTDHPNVGIRSRVEELISNLRLDCKDAFIVAVLGISGIGKTTIVKATYNRIAAEFDVSCFLGDIHYRCRGPTWKVDLPKELISCLAQNEKLPMIHSHNDGVTKIRKLISRQKVLLFLDNVENFQQLQALGIHPACFHDGSRIVVTTRDKQSLGALSYVPYNTSLLNRRESLELFTRLMFEKDDPVDKKFVIEVVNRAAGLPLVLEVWSRHFKAHEREQWPSVLETLKRIPHGEVQKQLQMSYDSLANKAKKLFLDIVCFFDGKNKDLVVKVSQDEDLAFFPDIEIRYLVDKSLVKIGTNSRVEMHHAIREMGKEIVRQENEDEPGKRTRLKDRRDVVRVLTECSGTKSVESIRLDYEEKKEHVIMQVESLRNMSNLRLIQLLDCGLSWTSSDDDMPSFSFKKLKYLEWFVFPFKCINIDMGNVVVIKLRESKLEILWEGFKSLKKLRILDVSRSSSLTKTGDLSELENLEELHLNSCENLEELDSSIGCLDKLAILDLRQCTRLKRLPSEMIGKLRSLRRLGLGHCPNIGRDEVIDPFLSSLKECRITWLDLSSCNILKISGEVGSLTWLKHLDLTGNGFPSLPDSLGQLHELNTIKLWVCDNMRSIPNLPPNITSVEACTCRSLVNLPSNMSELKFLTELLLDRCYQLGSGDPECLMKVTGLRNLKHLSMEDCNVSQVPNKIGNLVSLQKLNLSKNTFSSLPDSFGNLSQLVHLDITACSRLRLLPLLPSNLRGIDAYWCPSLDVVPFDKIQTTNIFRSKGCKESPFAKRLEIHLSGDDVVRNWCSYRDRGHVLSFVAPMHLDKKICGMILCATIQFQKYFHNEFTLKMLNKTKKTSHRLRKQIHGETSSLPVMFYPLNDTTLVVEAGDTVVIQFLVDEEDPPLVWSWGLRLIYEGDVVDSKLVIEPTPPIPSEMTTNITELNDISSESDDEVCSRKLSVAFGFPKYQIRDGEDELW